MALAAAALLILATGAAAEDKPAGASAAQEASANNPVSPLAVSQVPQSEIAPVPGTDGRYHVLYELQLTNTLSGTTELNAVEVIDERDGKTLLKLGAEDIRKGEYLHTLDRKTAEDISFPPFVGRVLILNLSLDAKYDVPKTLIHRFEVLGADPFTGKPAAFDYRGGSVEISPRQPPVLSPPLEGEGWLASDGCCGPTGHINALVGLNGRLQGAERFAIDWIKVGPDGHVFNGDKSKLESWVGCDGGERYGAGACAWRHA